MEFPKEVYVRIEEENNGSEYLVATDTPDGENGEKVGIYKLIEVKRYKITEELI